MTYTVLDFGVKYTLSPKIYHAETSVRTPPLFPPQTAINENAVRLGHLTPYLDDNDPLRPNTKATGGIMLEVG